MKFILEIVGYNTMNNLSLRGKIFLNLAFIKSKIRSWFMTWYLDFTTLKYTNIQYMSAQFKLSLVCSTFQRYYFLSHWWTPIMYQINPATIPIKQPVKLGMRWGGEAWLKHKF